jgi:N-acetylglucosamine-6-phosphate deacetylase
MISPSKTALLQDLWIDSTRGTILDAQKTFFPKWLQPATVIDLDGLILSPGLIDIQISGTYDFDFSVYENNDAYRAGFSTLLSESPKQASPP